MFAIGGLLFIISFIFAVMFTESFKTLYVDGYTDDVDYFGTLGKSAFTLFQIMTLDNWADLTRSMTQAYTWAWVPVVSFVIISGFIITNLIIAVICDAVAVLHDDDKAKLHGQQVDPTNGGKNGGNTDNNGWDSSSPSDDETPVTVMTKQLVALEYHINELTEIQNSTVLTLQQQLLLLQQQQRQQQ